MSLIYRFETQANKNYVNVYDLLDGYFRLEGRGFGSSGLKSEDEALGRARQEIDTWPQKRKYQTIGKRQVFADIPRR